MQRFLILFLLTTACLGAQGQQLAPNDYIYPLRELKQRLYSANFGEIRPGHFHAGVDIKTDAEEGKPVVAAADGYVSRVVLQAGGYGQRRLPHAPQRHDGRLRPPPAFPRRHRAARAQGALRTPFERREPLVRSRNVAREAGRRGGLLGRQRFVGRPAPPLTKSATRRPSGSTTPSAKESSAPGMNYPPRIVRLHYVEVDTLQGVPGAQPSRRATPWSATAEGRYRPDARRARRRGTQGLFRGRGHRPPQRCPQHVRRMARHGLRVDGIPYFEYRMDGFTYDLSRCCDAVSCYSLQPAFAQRSDPPGSAGRLARLFLPGDGGARR